ncbi:MAG TPA: xanthine dehydrogenase molybdopterin binding subunit [Burkholderiaceae bacterium]|nr:xanthine dehydrogenase molybdopterin binding subunit [Burkholderiaceae bacterium]
MNVAVETKVLQPTAAGVPVPHESAHLHVSGEATYVDDIPEAAGTLYAALGLSTKAHAVVKSIDLAPVRALPGVVAVLTAADIPGENNCGPIAHDDPIFADSLVQYIGQPMFAVIAESFDAARRAARQAIVQYEELPAVLTPQEAKRQQSFVLPPLHLKRGQPLEAIAAAPRRLKGEFYVGGQEQFYLEGQISYALPREDKGLLLYCSTQHPTEMQRMVCHTLNLRSHQVICEMRRMGGGFGGKESQSALFACVASLAAFKLKRPVKLRLDRDDDMMITGKRHDFHYEYEVGFDDDGRILGVRVEMVSRAGFSADLSGPVAARALCHFDNAYYLSDVDIKSMAGKTNTQSNTAFRGFGGPQGAVAIEYIIDSIARELGRDALDVRKVNFYGHGERDVTPYGMKVEDNVIRELVAELEASSEYRARRAAIRAFNETSSVLKKGIALTPVKFGISFNVVQYNQAGALVTVYTDGSVLVSHGGTEMGQGLNTKVAQVVAHELGISLKHVRASAADTSKVPNTSATAASTGADLNGKAGQDAARQIKARLAAHAARTYGGAPEDVAFANDTVSVNGNEIAFSDLVQEAYNARVQLWSDGFYATPKIHWNKLTLTGRPFFYFAYGAAVSEVIVDTLTGEFKLLRADLLHDAGNSINPAIDLGQVEGGFIQGMGWLTCEELWWNAKGALMTHAPSTYKIPAVNDCPGDFRARLYANSNAEDTILRSKAVGEPPLLLSFSVFFAIREAIASVGGYRVNPPLLAPATAESVLNAVEAVRAQAETSAGVPLANVQL